MYIRKDRRIQQYTDVSADDNPITALLECSGFEPLLITVDGGDINVAYEANGPWITLPDGYQYTWENKHPFGGEVFLDAVTTDVTVTFMIGGTVQ